VQVFLQLAYIKLDQRVRGVFMRKKGKPPHLLGAFPQIDECRGRVTSLESVARRLLQHGPL